MLRAVLLALALTGTPGAGWARTSTDVDSRDLRLTLRAVKPVVLVGEFTKVAVTWTTRRPRSIFPGAEIVLVDSGGGFVEHGEASEPLMCTLSTANTLRPGHVWHSEHVIGIRQVEVPATVSGLDAVHASTAFVFPEPGVYRIKVRYGSLESNVVEVRAVAPTGIDAEVFAALRAQPGLLTTTGSADADLAAAGMALIHRFGAHVYIVPLVRALLGDDRTSFDQRTALYVDTSAFAGDERLWAAVGGQRHLGSVWTQRALEDVIRDFPARAVSDTARDALQELLRVQNEQLSR